MKVYLDIQWKLVNICQTADLFDREGHGEATLARVPQSCTLAEQWSSPTSPHRSAWARCSPGERQSLRRECWRCLWQTASTNTSGQGLHTWGHDGSTPTAAQTLSDKHLQSKEIGQARAVNATDHFLAGLYKRQLSRLISSKVFLLHKYCRITHCQYPVTQT